MRKDKMKLEVRKIENKIALDTTMEGCGLDCIETHYESRTETTTMSGAINCLVITRTYKGPVFF